MSVEREMSLVEWCAKLPSQHLVNQELLTLNIQLAALAEQNEKMRKVLKSIGELSYDQGAVEVANKALSLPDLATPVLNQLKVNKEITNDPKPIP